MKVKVSVYFLTSIYKNENKFQIFDFGSSMFFSFVINVFRFVNGSSKLIGSNYSFPEIKMGVLCTHIYIYIYILYRALVVIAIFHPKY